MRKTLHKSIDQIGIDLLALLAEAYHGQAAHIG
jgi:hypothetical protein